MLMMSTIRASICKDSFSFPFPIGSTVAVQCKSGGPWAHGIVEEADSTDDHPTSSE